MPVITRSQSRSLQHLQTSSNVNIVLTNNTSPSETQHPIPTNINTTITDKYLQYNNNDLIQFIVATNNNLGTTVSQFLYTVNNILGAEAKKICIDIYSNLKHLKITKLRCKFLVKCKQFNLFPKHI